MKACALILLAAVTALADPAAPGLPFDAVAGPLRRMSCARRAAPTDSAGSPWRCGQRLALGDFGHARGGRQTFFFAQRRGLYRHGAGRCGRTRRPGRVISGGSTVTQQLVRLLEPRPKNLAAAKSRKPWAPGGSNINAPSAIFSKPIWESRLLRKPCAGHRSRGAGVFPYVSAHATYLWRRRRC